MIFTRFLIAVAAVAFSLHSVAQDPPFEVSLTSPRFVDLSPCYQRVIREATGTYIGDFSPDRSIFLDHSVQIIHVRGPDLITRHIPPELQHARVPFLSPRLTLRLDTIRDPCP